MAQSIKNFLSLIPYPRKTARHLIDSQDETTANLSLFLIGVIGLLYYYRLISPDSWWSAILTIAITFTAVVGLNEMLMLLSTVLLKATQKRLEGTADWREAHLCTLWSFAPAIVVQLVLFAIKLIFDLAYKAGLCQSGQVYLTVTLIITYLFIAAILAKFIYQAIMLAEANHFSIQKSILNNLLPTLVVLPLLIFILSFPFFLTITHIP